jgi:hypothetical protein
MINKIKTEFKIQENIDWIQFLIEWFYSDFEYKLQLKIENNDYIFVNEIIFNDVFDLDNLLMRIYKTLKRDNKYFELNNKYYLEYVSIVFWILENHRNEIIEKDFYNFDLNLV